MTTIQLQQNIRPTFPWILHSMLEEAESKGFADIVSWVPGTNYFKVHDSKAFLEQILPNYFTQTKYKSFLRQLNLYYFLRNGTGGPYNGAYSHPLFIPGQPRLCKYILRIKGKQKQSNSMYLHTLQLQSSVSGQQGGTSHQQQQQLIDPQVERGFFFSEEGARGDDEFSPISLAYFDPAYRNNNDNTTADEFGMVFPDSTVPMINNNFSSELLSEGGSSAITSNNSLISSSISTQGPMMKTSLFGETSSSSSSWWGVLSSSDQKDTIDGIIDLFGSGSNNNNNNRKINI